MTTAGRVAANRYLRAGAILAVAVFSFVACALPSILAGHVPWPAVHDEFAYLLQADTFAHGRLANPPHPLWQFFETYHVIQQPTYAAKFPPGQGLTLAAGQKLAGLPIIGVWLTIAASAAAITWMLLGTLPPRWALIGGLFAAAHPLIIWWGQTYWGGGVALLGSALLGGATIRMLRRIPRPRWGVLAGCGCAILSISRPFEGLIVIALAGAGLVITAIQRAWLRQLLTLALPAGAAVMFPVLLGIGYYNWRVTRNPFELPYLLHARQYMVAPLMYWQKPNPRPHYRYPEMRRFYCDYEYGEYARQTTLRGFLAGIVDKSVSLVAAFIRSWGLPVLPLLACMLRLPRCRAVLWATVVCLGLPFLQMLCTPWMRNQYMAPATAFFFTLIGVGLWRISRFRWQGVYWGRTLVTVLLLAQFIKGASVVRNSSINTHGFGWLRTSLVQRLRDSSAGKKQLCFVHAGPQSTTAGFVYNPADIDSAPLVFAHDMELQRDRALMDYYPDRQVWLLNADDLSLTAIQR